MCCHLLRGCGCRRNPSSRRYWVTTHYLLFKSSLLLLPLWLCEPRNSLHSQYSTPWPVLSHLESRLLMTMEAIIHELLQIQIQIINCSIHGFSPTVPIPSCPSSFILPFPLRAILKAPPQLTSLAWFSVFCNWVSAILALPWPYKFSSIYLHKGSGNSVGFVYLWMNTLKILCVR